MQRALIALTALLLVVLTGCPASSPVQTAVPPAAPQVEINGMMSCDYVNGVLSNCALDAGVTLDDLANSFLQGESVTQ